uniref:Uncharacterized protein n=1 Tax=viral metagenome TaxID=1070528 RepID=A0A6M3M039_9ZZZZ
MAPPGYWGPPARWDPCVDAPDWREACVQCRAWDAEGGGCQDGRADEDAVRERGAPCRWFEAWEER